MDVITQLKMRFILSYCISTFFLDIISMFNYTNPGYGFSLVDTLWNAGSHRQPLEQEDNPMT